MKNKVKKLFKKVEDKLRKVFKFVENTLSVKAKIAVGLVTVLLVVFSVASLVEKNDITANSVMITNIDGTHGGSGVILKSSQARSEVLTNAHICKVIQSGGVVSSKAGMFLVATYKVSKFHDVCLLTVNGNLQGHTKVASSPSRSYYDKATISGHPALLPNVMTSGHVSGRKIIPVLLGFRPCTDKDLEDPKKGAVCVIAGALPEVRLFNSLLVTATIMPGSSGSGVYNEDMELMGLAFAGSGNLGYAWTVPYESLKFFLEKEVKTLEEKAASTLLFGESEDESNKGVDTATVLKKLKKVCSESSSAELEELCRVVKGNTLWIKD